MLSLDQKFDVCDKCEKYYLNTCNLCKQETHCTQCGCKNCKLEKDANTPALSTLNDDTRKTLLQVSERQTNLKPQKSTKTKAQKAAKAKKINYNELWLDDLMEYNEKHHWSDDDPDENLTYWQTR